MNVILGHCGDYMHGLFGTSSCRYCAYSITEGQQIQNALYVLFKIKIPFILHCQLYFFVARHYGPKPNVPHILMT